MWKSEHLQYGKEAPTRVEGSLAFDAYVSYITNMYAAGIREQLAQTTDLLNYFGREGGVERGNTDYYRIWRR